MNLGNHPDEVLKILIVDDEPGVLNAMSRLLHDESYEILTATGGESALELLQRSGPVQLIISDYRMPGMTGVEFLQQVMQRSPDTRRVILSGFPDSDVLLAALNEGRVHRFLVKPWNNDAIKAVITEMLDEYRMLVNFRRNAEQLAHNNRLLARTNEHLSAILSEVLTTMRGETSGGETPSAHPQSNLPSQLKSEENLSSREREILHAIAAGRSLKAIAMDLELSIKTVSTYKKRLFDKMGFKNSAELIVYTLKNSLHPTSRL
jgi:DNA-binding NarL/FixJ family response regulator